MEGLDKFQVCEVVNDDEAKAADCAAAVLRRVVACAGVRVWPGLWCWHVASGYNRRSSCDDKTGASTPLLGGLQVYI